MVLLQIVGWKKVDALGHHRVTGDNALADEGGCHN